MMLLGWCAVYGGLAQSNLKVMDVVDSDGADSNEKDAYHSISA